ncbi:MAG: hypothetical protein ACOZBL_01280 [Patescibacteria group bacterium]
MADRYVCIDFARSTILVSSWIQTASIFILFIIKLVSIIKNLHCRRSNFVYDKPSYL